MLIFIHSFSIFFQMNFFFFLIFSASCYQGQSLLFQKGNQIARLLPLYFPKAYLVLPNSLPPTRLFPRLEGFPSVDISHIQCSLTLAGGGVTMPPQCYQQAGCSPGELQSRYTWSPLHAQLIVYNTHPWKSLPKCMCIISMLASSREGKFSHSFHKMN